MQNQIRNSCEADAIRSAESFMKSSIFKDLTTSQMREVAKSAVSVRFRQGSFVFRQSDPARFFYIVREGSVKVHATSPSGKTMTFSIAASGDTLNASALWAGSHFLSAQALTDVIILRIERSVFLGFLDRFPSLAFEIISVLESRLCAEYERRVSMQQGEVNSRVIRGLLEMATKFGPTIRLRRHELAEYVGTTKETAIRVLSVLKKNDVISQSSRRGEIIVADLPKLRYLVTRSIA